MEEVTILLFIAAMLCYVLSLKLQTRAVSMMTLVLAVCGLSAVFQDASVSGNIVYLIAFPMIAVTLFAIADLCVIKELK